MGEVNEPIAATALPRPRDDVLLYKILRVRARIGLYAARSTRLEHKFPTELRLLDEVIEELTGVEGLAEDA